MTIIYLFISIKIINERLNIGYQIRLVESSIKNSKDATQTEYIANYNATLVCLKAFLKET